MKHSKLITCKILLFLILYFSLFAPQTSYSVEWYTPPPLTEVFNKSDVIAIVKIISGESLPIEKGGGRRVKGLVVESIKGTKKNDILDIYYAAGNLGAIYMATLLWDKKLNGYKYYGHNQDIILVDFTSIENGKADIEKNGFGYPNYSYNEIKKEFMDGWGMKGQPILFKNSKYYLPACNSACELLCQDKFDFVQFMLSKGNLIK